MINFRCVRRFAGYFFVPTRVRQNYFTFACLLFLF